MTKNDDDVTMPVQKSPASQGKRLGRYELLERLGKGGMGIVYRARDTKLDRPVAVKLLLTDLEGDSETRERFLREARAAGELSHRNIIKVYDFGEDGGRAFIVME
ncbi:MAG: protein kinase, partial [Vicinamibacterales bacterium]|nr:protein kinase [Vicinamibacterales bacterium]